MFWMLGIKMYDSFGGFEFLDSIRLVLNLRNLCHVWFQTTGNDEKMTDAPDFP